MKKIFKSILVVFAAVSLSVSCESDSTKDTGNAVIYIPQANITGLDNTYPIPNGSLNQNTNYVCKYDKATGMLGVNVGVIRAGYINNAKGFSVDLKECSSETERKVNELGNAMAIPSDCFSIPAKIEVPAGKNSATCYVSINLQKLSANKASFFDGTEYKKLVLGLEIANPTAYELAETNTKVVIVLDLNSEHWDTVSADKPESAVRILFPLN